MKTLVLLMVLGTAAPFASAAARTPTNDVSAFRMFDLYAERTASANTIDHVNFFGYPSSLASPPPLLVTRPTPGSGDSVTLFNSFAKDAISLEVNASQPQSFSTYTVSPPQYATSLGTLLEGVLVFNGTGQWADLGKPLDRPTVTYVDGDTAVVTLHVGYHIRDYFDSGYSCNFVDIPFYTTRPSDPLSAYIYETGGIYFDAQESLLPKSKRPKRIVSVRVEGVLLTHFCNVTYYSSSRFAGLSIWPAFSIVNASSQPVVRQSQGTGADHGGYLFGSTVVGLRRTTDKTACKVASLAMAYTYSGFNCSVDSLNAHLQRSQGYKPDQVAIVGSVSPTGDAITFTATGGTELIVGDRFLVERGTYSMPLATYQVIVAYQRQPYVAGQATRVLSHNATIPVTGDAGRVYWNTIPRRADRYTNSPQLRSIEIPATQMAAQVESLLVRDIPVQLNVGPSGGHWVVADGWTSSFRPGGSARGTYWIKDPFDPRNYSKLIEGQYRNTFVAARYVVPTGLGPLEHSAVLGSGTPGLTFLASGARRIEIVDPLGRRILRDATSGEAISEIPEASAEGVSSEHDNGGAVDDPLTGFDVDIPTAVDGTYTVRTYVDDGLAMSASGYDDDGVFASAAAVDTTAGPVGSLYTVQYSGSGGTVIVSYGGSVGVESAPIGPGFLRVGRNPTTGPVAFLLTRSDPAEDAIEIFDVGGRKVDVIEVVTGQGTQTVSWDWRARNCRPGVYMARMRSEGRGKPVRFVVLR